MTTGSNACFTPIRIGTKTATNRFVVQPMEFNDAIGGDDPANRGNPTKRTLNRYRNLFTGGAGLIVLEAISIGDTSMARTHQLTILPRNAKALAAFVAELRQVNAKPLFVAQLTHSGEISGPFSKRVSPKQMAGFELELLSDEDADRIIDEFVEAAKIAHDVGLDGLDIKFCHGYPAPRSRAPTTTANGSTAAPRRTVSASATRSTSG